MLIVISVGVGFYINEQINKKENSQVIKNINIVEEDTIRKAIDKVYDSVLLIDAYSINGMNSIGSGFIYKVDQKYGYILTNNHVIDNSDSITVVTSDNKEYTAKLLGSDELMDLAVLCIDKSAVIKKADIGNSSLVNVGDTVFTIGSPGGFEYMGTVTKGIISGLNREINIELNKESYIINVMQTDAAINPGNSGGPLVNINGEVIGINSLKIVKDEIEGMGFAIPIEEVLLYTDRLEKGIKIKRPYLGLELINDVNGVVIKNIHQESPVKDLKINDVLISIDDTIVKDIIHFRYLLYKHEIGDVITIKYLRNNREYNEKILLSK